jgi:hypothetical protein
MSRFVGSCLLAVVLITGCVGGDKHAQRTWSVTVANNIGGPWRMAEAYHAAAEAHGEMHSCTLDSKGRLGGTRTCVYAAAYDGCFEGLVKNTGKHDALDAVVYNAGKLRLDPREKSAYEQGRHNCATATPSGEISGRSALLTLPATSAPSP